MTDIPEPAGSAWQSTKRNVFVGFLALVPLWITITVIGVLLTFLRNQTSPLLGGAFQAFSPGNAIFDQLLNASWFQTLAALILLLLIFYLIGFLTTRWLGRKAMAAVDQIMERIPVAKSIYGAIKGVTDAMQKSDASSSKVVLIGFPSRELKTIGLVTKTVTDKVTEEELAVVFVPTSPTPTSGYVEVVPKSDLIYTDWSFEQAMSFLMSGGTDVPMQGLTLARGPSDK